MIKVTTHWTCTLCGHGKPFDPLVEYPPVTCPACNHKRQVQGSQWAHAKRNPPMIGFMVSST